jgi:hypothetical protein
VKVAWWFAPDLPKKARAQTSFFPGGEHGFFTKISAKKYGYGLPV